MTGASAPLLLDRLEPRRDGRAGADAMAALLQGDSFARMLDATLERTADEPRPAAAERERPAAARDAAPDPREPAPRAETARPEPGADHRAAASDRTRTDEARPQGEPDTAEPLDAEEVEAAAEPDAEPEAAAETGEAEAAPESGDDALQDLLKLMSPAALRAFQAAAGGGADAVSGVAGPHGAASLPTGLRPLLLNGTATAPAAETPEPPVPPARVVGQVLQALSRAEGLGDGRGTVKLALDPAHLGKVEVTVTRHEGRLEVTFKVESAEAEHALRSRAGELGQALLGKGSGWSDVTVTVVREGEDDENAPGREQPGDQDGRNARQDEDGSDPDTGEGD
ncbi:MAG TPA: flagellar hook-length control protein FliK [Candidatus Krumholzibacteria bacterium]|nr:flagellar hook-length control protein FliK [Candidatus Krumholzibacteria bacterium]